MDVTTSFFINSRQIAHIQDGPSSIWKGEMALLPLVYQCHIHCGVQEEVKQRIRKPKLAHDIASSDDTYNASLWTHVGATGDSSSLPTSLDFPHNGDTRSTLQNIATLDVICSYGATGADRTNVTMPEWLQTGQVRRQWTFEDSFRNSFTRALGDQGTIFIGVTSLEPPLYIGGTLVSYF